MQKRENSFNSNKFNKGSNLNEINKNTIKNFCYYKFLEKNSVMFNPLKNNIDFKNLEYNEGLISRDNSTNTIKIIPIHSYQNNTNYLNITPNMLNNSPKLNILNIELKNITNVYLNNLMENIIKIHNIFLKYNSNKNKENGIEKAKEKEPISINQFLNLREIMNIKDLSQGEKIRAGLCNFFSIIVEYNNFHKIELILINFNQFNSWLNYLKDVLDNNIKAKKFIINDFSSCKSVNKKRIMKNKSKVEEIKNN